MRGLSPPWSTNACQTCGSKPVHWLCTCGLLCSNHMDSFLLHPFLGSVQGLSGGLSPCCPLWVRPEMVLVLRDLVG